MWIVEVFAFIVIGQIIADMFGYGLSRCFDSIYYPIAIYLGHYGDNPEHIEQLKNRIKRRKNLR